MNVTVNLAKVESKRKKTAELLVGEAVSTTYAGQPDGYILRLEKKVFLRIYSSGGKPVLYSLEELITYDFFTEGELLPKGTTFTITI